MKAINKLDKTHTAVPIGKYKQLFDAATKTIELLKPQTTEMAKQSHATLSALSAKLTVEQESLSNAQKAFKEAKAAAKRARKLATKLVPTAITLGELLDIVSVANFTPPDDSWTEAVEALAMRFEAHDKLGKGIAAMMRAQVDKRRAAENAVAAGMKNVDGASQAFSATYTHLSKEIVFGRAVLLKLDVAVTAPGKPGKKRKAAETPVAPASQPAPVAAA